MTVEQLIEDAVRDAVMETGYDKPQHNTVLKECQFAIVRNAKARICDNQLVFNKLRDLLSRRRPK